jgi:pSer/pThr/pTyr-binding forkhead associated (FHA) protein
MSASGFYLLAQDGKRVDLKDKQLLGRETTCDIVLSDGQPSRRHAEIVINMGQVTLVDLGSTNGSYVNDSKLTPNTPIAIKVGDVIRMDANSFTLAQQPGDANATVMRAAPLHDANATVMRAAPSVQTPPAEPLAPKLPPKPAAPESWALQGQQAVAGTQLLTGTQVAGLRAALNAEALVKTDVPTLTLVSSAYQGKQFALTGASKWEIGRGATCDIVIDDPSVSSSHAQIINEGARWKLIDLMSANGTYVNSEKGLTTYLGNGDLLRFGTVDAVIQLGGAAANVAKTSSMATGPAATRSTAGIAAIAFAVTLVLIAAAFLVFK